MTTEVINLRHARKANVRTAKKRLADENRIRFGRTKTEKLKVATETKRAERAIESHRRERE